MPAIQRYIEYTFAHWWVFHNKIYQQSLRYVVFIIFLFFFSINLNFEEENTCTRFWNSFLVTFFFVQCNSEHDFLVATRIKNNASKFIDFCYTVKLAIAVSQPIKLKFIRTYTVWYNKCFADSLTNKYCSEMWLQSEIWTIPSLFVLVHLFV